MDRTRGSMDDYTPEERIILTSLRRDSRRTCIYCSWFVAKGGQKGCFPEGDYRKWLSPEEFNSGCDGFAPKRKAK